MFHRPRPEIVTDPALVACCGLYCAACPAFLRGKCPGCSKNDKATWCQVRACCREAGRSSCAECAEFADVSACRKYNNFLARLFGFLFRSDRAACICQIRECGLDKHAATMAEAGIHTLPR